ncbi:MAG TPA: DUF1684 domain-containing protein [Pyrinomonadaceae bacterium]|jgi:uncharacterized protein (DUF1684 family)
MKRAALIIFLLVACALLANAQESNRTGDVQSFREARDKVFRNPRLTPLANEDFTNFKGLEYFAESEKYVVRARLEKTSDAQFFMMPTSVGAPRKYFKYGVLTFEIDGQSFTLNAYQSEEAARRNVMLFVPFRDLTNGAETYGAGRYLDIKIPSESEIVLNFNIAYNPSCAYSDRFSCAIPPKENFLQTEIRAGEKIFHAAAKKQ